MAFGPWSAGAASKRSQLARTVHMLEAHGLWTGDHAKAANQLIELPNIEGTSLRSTIAYLIQMHGVATVQPMFETILPHAQWSKLEHWNGTSAILDALKVAISNDDSSRNYSRKRDAAIDVTGFRRAWQVDGIYGGIDSTWNPRRCDELRIGLDHGVLKFATTDAEAPEPVPLDDMLDRLSITGGETLGDEQLRVDFQRNGRSFRVVFSSLNFRHNAKSSAISNAQLMLMER